MQVQRPGTGPLTTIPPQQRTETRHQPAGTGNAPAPAENGPGVDNQTQIYGETAIDDPGAVQFPTGRTEAGTLNPMRQRYLNALESMITQGVAPTDDQNTAQFLANTLGFQNPQMMMHHLRNLSPAQKTQLMDSLRTQLSQGNGLPDTAITQAFETVFKEGINGMAAAHGAPPPKLTPEGRGWNTAALASVFNAMHTIQSQSPQRLATVLERPGLDPQGNRRPLTFNRESRPAVHSNPDRFMDGLTDASRIAHAEPNNGEITIYDTAVSGDHTEITRNIVGKMDLLSRIDPHNGRELEPRYTRGELTERGIDRQQGETEGRQATRLRQTVQGEWANRFGGWENLQKAMNFMIRYKALDRPEVANPPFRQVPENGNPNDPETVAMINRMGVNNLQMLMARMEQQDAVAQIQGFLAENAPPGSPARQISSDGVLGPQTRQVVLGFETALGLNTLRERIEDDPNIPETRKVELVQYLNQQFGRLAANPTQSAQITRDVTQHIQGVLAEAGLPMAEHTRSGLTSDLRNMRSLGDGNFDRQSAEHLVNSWFNVMDSGQGQDLAEQLLVHEMGHLWEAELNANTDLDIRTNWSQFFRPEQLEGKAGHSIHHINQNDYSDALHNDQTAASAYGAVNPEEDFAEASRVFSYDPQRLMRRSLTKFLVMNSLNGNPYSAEQIRTMAAECGYRPEDILQRLNSVLGHGDNPLNFTLPMSQRLNTDYAELRRQLAGGTEPAPAPPPAAAPPPGPAAMGAAGAPAEAPVGPPEMEAASAPPEAPEGTDTPPETGAAATTPPTTDTSVSTAGDRFNQISDRYRALYERLAQPGADRTAIQAEIQQLNQEVLSQDDPALSSVLEQRQLGATPEAGRAIVAALAIYRATGEFDRDAHPEIAEHLHPGVDLALQNPLVRSALTDNSFEANALLRRSLNFCAQSIRHFDAVDQAFALPGNQRLNSLRDSIRELLASRNSNQISESELQTQIRSLFQSTQNQTLMNNFLRGINKGVQSMNQATGQRFPRLTMQQLQQILIQGAQTEMTGQKPDYRHEIMHAIEGARYTG